MKQFELKAHTADIRIIAEASTFKELFQVALEGLCSFIQLEHTSRKINYLFKAQLHIKSVDETALLIDFLSDALAQMYKQRAIFAQCEFQVLESTELKCTLIGFPVSGFSEDVKAVTYHEAEVKFENNIYKTAIVLDL